MKQLCWKCRKATNGNLCPWVGSFIYPEGVQLDRNNYIVSCPLFVPDGISEFNEKDKLIERFGISERSYYRHKFEYITLYNKYKDYENLPKISELCEVFGKSTQKIMENHEFFIKKYLTIFGKSV